MVGAFLIFMIFIASPSWVFGVQLTYELFSKWFSDSKLSKVELNQLLDKESEYSGLWNDYKIKHSQLTFLL